MPEGEVVGRIDGEHAIISPAAARVGLMSCACDQNCFALRQRIQRVAGQTPGIPDRGFGGRARDRIANRHIAQRIHRDAGHKAPQPVRGIIKRLLLDRSDGNGAASNVKLIPTNRRRTGPTLVVVNGVRGVQRFDTGEILVNERRHDFIAQCVEQRRCHGLRHKVGRSGKGIDEAADGDVAIRCVSSANTESRISRRRKIDMETPDMDLSQRYAAASGTVDREKIFRCPCRWSKSGPEACCHQAIRVAQSRR